MLEAAVVGLLTAFPLVGLVTRRWLAVTLPLIGWPIFYAGLNRGWWSDGTGDGWQIVCVSFTVIGVASTALGVLVGRRFVPTRRTRRFPNPS